VIMVLWAKVAAQFLSGGA